MNINNLSVFKACSDSHGDHSSAIVSYSQVLDLLPWTKGGGKLFTGVLSWFPMAG